VADVFTQQPQAMRRSPPAGRNAPAGKREELAAESVVLEPTRRGREELAQPRFGLGGNQRRLLAQLDGRRSLADCATADPRLQQPRLARDAARLVAFGLARQVRGELPQQLLVAAMNLTARIPLDRLPPLEPERTVMPMAPRVARAPSRREPVREDRPPRGDRPLWSIVLLLVLIAAAVAAIGHLT
jgi:hypothetical protein